MIYENAMEACVQSIFKSGMLLNEHDELLTQFWKPIPLTKFNYTKIYLASAGLVASFLIGTCKKWSILQVITIIPIGTGLCRFIHQKYKIKCCNERFVSLIEALQGIYSLTKKILQQYQLRKASINKLNVNTKRTIESVILNHMLSLLIEAGEHTFDLVLFSNKTLKEIGNMINIADLSFVFLIDLEEAKYKFNDTTEESILSTYDRIYMTYIYITSSFLCGFGLNLCSNQWKSRGLQFSTLFFSILPRYLKYVVHIHGKLKDTYHLMCNTMHIENTPVTNINKPIINIVNNLQEQIQVSYHVLTALQTQLATNNDSELEITTYLDDLENLFARCNDTLNILQYSANKIPAKETEIITKKPIEDVDHKEDDPAVIRHDDLPKDVSTDEEFNLSIHGSDSSDNETTSSLEYEQLLEYVKAQKLMIRELNDELRKRNYIKQDTPPVPAKRRNIKEQDIPARPPLPSPVAQLENTRTLSIPNVPPPPPINACEEQSYVSNDFLAQIRAAASSRGFEEIVFGDDIIESSSDDSTYSN